MLYFAVGWFPKGKNLLGGGGLLAWPSLSSSSTSYFKERVSVLDRMAGCPFAVALRQAVAALQGGGNRGFVEGKAALCAYFSSDSLTAQLRARL